MARRSTSSGRWFPLLAAGVVAASCQPGGGGRGDGVPPELSADDVLGRIGAELDRIEAERAAIRAELLGLTADGGLGPDALDGLAWDPSHDSVTFRAAALGDHTPLLISNDAAKAPASQHEVLATAATLGRSRIAALGANALSDLARTPPPPGSPEAAMVTFSERLVRWLVGDRAATLEGRRVVLAHLADSYWFRHDEGTPLFFASSFPGASVTAEDSCEGAALSACLDDAALLVVSGDDGTDDDHGLSPSVDAALAAVDEAVERGIPVLYVQYDGDTNALSAGLLERLGLRTTDNYWRQERIVAFDPTGLAADAELAAVRAAVDTLRGGTLTTADYAACIGTEARLTGCDAAGLQTSLLDGLMVIRQAFVDGDASGRTPFDGEGSTLLPLFAWLGDLYRAGGPETPALTYPVDPSTDPAGVARALAADATVCLTCDDLRAQRDLGTWVCPRDSVRDGSCAPYEPTAVPRSRRDVEATFLASDEWTSTGGYALAGEAFTATRTDGTDAPLYVRVGFPREGTTRSLESSGGVSTYDRPHYLTSPWVRLEAGETVSLSSPYGGPIYVRLDGDASVEGLPARVRLESVGAHPALLDVGDASAVAAFVADVQDNPLPHVDLRATGFETHLRRDKFVETAFGASEVAATDAGDAVMRRYDGDVAALVADYRDHFVGVVYGLAGFARPGGTLASTLSTDVVDVCTHLGLDCLDASVHARRSIQHANYDENANCGYGCSGNPFDAAWSIDPLGWGEAHELGHNLQMGRLDVAFVASGEADEWARYARRAGENSNNIFPYFVKYRFLRRVLGDDRPFVDGHMDFADAFAAAQSSAAGLQRDDGTGLVDVVFDASCGRLATTAPSVLDPVSEAVWEDPAYAADNGLRMAFYLDLPLRLAGRTLPGGTVLDDGFDVFPVLYAYAREFDVAARSEASWLAARDRLGFGALPYAGEPTYGGGTVRDMPGNDFLLVALAMISGLDPRPLFAVHGVRTTGLAATQLEAHLASGRVAGAFDATLPVLETDFMPRDLTSTAWVAVDGVASFPRTGFHPSSCP